MTNEGWGDAINSEPWNTVNKVFFKEALKELENQKWKVKFCHELKTSWERETTKSLNKLLPLKMEKG